MTRLLYKNSNFKVFSRMIKNSCAENNVNACKTCASIEIINSLIKNLCRLLRKNQPFRGKLNNIIYMALHKFGNLRDFDKI